MRVLTPTDNKRFNELMGFVGLSLAVLLALSLLSYSPHDASFNVSATPLGSTPAQNWIGPVGAYLSDLFFQFCGFSAFLFPVGLFVVSMRWFRSQALVAPVAKLLGSAMLLTSLSAELALLRAPEVRGALPAGGLFGTMLAEGLRAAFNPLGANLISIATLLTALFMTTSFSLRAAGRWMKRPMADDGHVWKMVARVKEWRERRESERLRKRVEEIKIAGRPPVPQQKVSR
ncbi:MAG: DNA translocase FtsK 4TM domain-containing protein, partial [Terracidiphilus sp.]